jgi:hypothetical protein
MTTKWDDLVALAREIERARSTGALIDPEKARRLARTVLALGDERRRALTPNEPTDNRRS